MSDSHRIPAGIHRAKAVAGSEQYGETSNHHDQIVIDLAFVDGYRASTFLVFSEAAAPYSMQRLRALGWTGTNLADLTGIDTNEVDVEVRYEMYQGEEKMKVQIVSGGTVVLKNTFDEKGKKAFAAKYAALAKSTPAVQPATRPQAKPASAPQSAPASTGTDDEIPF